MEASSKKRPAVTPRRFAIIGAAGFVAPRHLLAIRDTGNDLVAAVDPSDSVGILDGYFPQARFFTEIERFDRFLEKQRKTNPVEFISICSPNYLHDAHVRTALRVKAHPICEKPLVINPWNLDQLRELQEEHQRKIYNILQLRMHPAIRALKDKLASAASSGQKDVELTYITRRGPWYQTSWKGQEEKSGGIAMNIGIHFFDLLLWLFGPVERNVVHLAQRTRMAGFLEMEHAKVRWYLSVDGDDLTRVGVEPNSETNRHAYRELSVDGKNIDLSAHFTDLHTEVYREILAGRGHTVDDAQPSIDLVYNIRQTKTSSLTPIAHPFAIASAK